MFRCWCPKGLAQEDLSSIHGNKGYEANQGDFSIHTYPLVVLNLIVLRISPCLTYVCRKHLRCASQHSTINRRATILYISITSRKLEKMRSGDDRLVVVGGGDEEHGAKMTLSELRWKANLTMGSDVSRGR